MLNSLSKSILSYFDCQNCLSTVRGKSVSITNQIPQVCCEKGLTTAYQLAMRCGIKRTTAYRLWDNPEAYPTRKTMMKLCDGLGVTPGEILLLLK